MVHYWRLFEIWSCSSCSLWPLVHFWWGTQFLLWKLKVFSDWHHYDRWNNQQWKIYLCNTSWVHYPWYMSPAKQTNHPSSTSRAPVRLIRWWPALVHDNLDIRKIKQILIKQGLDRNVVIDIISIVITVMSTECCRRISTPIKINIWSEVYINSPSDSSNHWNYTFMHLKNLSNQS